MDCVPTPMSGFDNPSDGKQGPNQTLFPSPDYKYVHECSCPFEMLYKQINIIIQQIRNHLAHCISEMKSQRAFAHYRKNTQKHKY